MLEAAVSMHPFSHSANLLRAQVNAELFAKQYLESGSQADGSVRQRAIDAYTYVLASPYDVASSVQFEAHRSLASLHSSAGDVDKQLHHLGRVVSLEPAHATLQHEYGSLLLKQSRRLEEAVDALKVAVQLTPERSSCALGVALNRQQRRASVAPPPQQQQLTSMIDNESLALPHLERCLRTAKDPSQLFYAGLSTERTDGSGLSAALLERALELQAAEVVEAEAAVQPHKHWQMAEQQEARPSPGRHRRPPKPAAAAATREPSSATREDGLMMADDGFEHKLMMARSAYYALGRMATRRGDAEGAARLYERAVQDGVWNHPLQRPGYLWCAAFLRVPPHARAHHGALSIHVHRQEVGPSAPWPTAATVLEDGDVAGAARWQQLEAIQETLEAHAPGVLEEVRALLPSLAVWEEGEAAGEAAGETAGASDATVTATDSATTAERLEAERGAETAERVAASGATLATAPPRPLVGGGTVDNERLAEGRMNGREGPQWRQWVFVRNGQPTALLQVRLPLDGLCLSLMASESRSVACRRAPMRPS